MKREIDTGWIKPIGWISTETVIGDGGGGCILPYGGAIDPWEGLGDGGSGG